MSLRLALVISGDPAGAKKALAETATAVEDLGNKAETAGKKVDASFKGFEWESSEATRARLGLKEIADEGDRAAAGITAAGEAGGTAAPEIAKIGTAADGAREKFGGLTTVLAGAAGGLAAGIAMTAISEGLNLAIGKAAALFREITSNQPEIDRALTSHAELVGRIKGAWSEAGGAASSYGVNSIAQLRFESQQNINRVGDASEAAQGDLLRGSDALRPSDVLGNPFGRFGPFKDEVSELRQELKGGEADVIAFRRAVAEIAETLPSESPFRGLAEQIFEDTEAAAELQAELKRSQELIQALKGDADAAATSIGGKAEKYHELSDGAATASGAVTQSNTAIAATAGAASQAIGPLSEYSRLLGSIGGAGTSRPFNAVRAATTAPFNEFSGGGATGTDGADTEIDGYVHKNEFVFSAPATRRLGTGFLTMLHQQGKRGYAAGGVVGGYSGEAAGLFGGNDIQGTARDFSILRGSISQFSRAILSGATAGDAFKQMLVSLADKWIDKFTSMIEAMILEPGSVRGAAGGGGLGGLAGQLFGGLGSAFTRMISPQAALAFAGEPRLYDVGGATRTDGPDTEIDGYAHKNEFIFSAPATRRLGTGFLNALHQAGKRGYQEGGLVGASGYADARSGPLVEIKNYSSAEISQREESDGRGGRRLVMELSDAVAAGLNRPGSSLDKAMARRGAKQPLARR